LGHARRFQYQDIPEPADEVKAATWSEDISSIAAAYFFARTGSVWA
jgi:hypothetical protein